MPLLIVCGYPASGKTSRSLQLQEYFSQNAAGLQVDLVSDESFWTSASAPDRNAVYNNAQLEKQMRGSLKSHVERALTSKNLVIFDAANYIKGYRYELYCVAKAQRSTHCLVLSQADVDTIRLHNAARACAKRYDDVTLAALLQRFEPPSAHNRWDAPLFVVSQSELMPFDAIRQALFDAPPPKQNQSTMLVDKMSKEIIDELLTQVNDDRMSFGQSVTVSLATDPIQLSRQFSAAELHRARRQFLIYIKQHPPSTDTVWTPDMLANSFVKFLNTHLC